MCDPVSIGIGLTVATAGMQVAQGYSQQSAFKQEANNARLTGRQALDAANVEANQVRARGSRELGNIRAIQAARGVDIGSGSAADVGGRVAQNAEHEALMKMYEGQLGDWQAKYKAQVLKTQGKAAVVGGIANAAGTLLTGAITGGFFGATPAAAAPVGGGFPL